MRKFIVSVKNIISKFNLMLFFFIRSMLFLKFITYVKGSLSLSIDPFIRSFPILGP